ncbi:ATP-binding protein [Kineosporia sp. NBRC 101731]|uniref:ATP-binding protein n=1 Tax=Kineosporia sp. NBRC 101731 TaxID=3032199 RepID=UPI0024A0B636|nr:ATP-binding protein [Kineosporia sp. NBRC 101731]GLY27678.1 histidine kinase [Kineosporia sp. NBRC 101731]
MTQTQSVAGDTLWERIRQPRVWGVHGRIAAALVVVVALLTGVVTAAVVTLLETRQVQREVVRDYYDGLRSSQNYFIAMLDSETAIRGYALTHDKSALDPLNDSGQPWDHPVSGNLDTVLPDTSVVPKMQEAEKAAQVWYYEWAAPTIQSLEDGADLTEADFTEGRQLFDVFRARYTEAINILRPEREKAADHLGEVTNLGFAIGVLSAIICLVAGVVLWILMRRWVSRPVAFLAGEARIVANGELSHQVIGIGPPEFVQLGADVEMMRHRLISEVEKAEQARRETLQARTILEEQTQELQRSNRELEQFAYVASHDLQEPLRKVASFCQMLQRRYGGQLDDRADQYIHFAVDGAKRMQQLINDLLEFSRVGRLSTPSADVDLSECLANALLNLETAKEESAAEVTADDLPVVHGEAPLLTQVLQNLIGNAIKFRAGAAPRIRITTRRDGDFWEFTCTDNGIGIEQEYADRVFLIFQRLHAKEAYGGTGIGLAMCKKIIEYHGGKIWVEPPAADAVPEPRDGVWEPGQDGPGTTIRWTLPVNSDLKVLESEPTVKVMR